MEKKITLREQKRIETDEKILKAAISTIGKKGYTASTIRDIAKAAGVTSGLIMQRFESKENLVIQALCVTNQTWSDSYMPDDMTAYEMLTHIINDAKHMCEYDTEGFDFIYTMCSSADIPDSVYKLQKEIFYEQGMYRALKNAQDAGNLPEGDLAYMYNIFTCNSLRLIRDYKRSGLKMPKDENFLSIIQYKDYVAEEQQLYRNKAFESIAESFFILIYFNITTGKYRVAKLIKGVDSYIKKYTNGQELLNHACEEMVDINYIDTIKKFVDLSTVIERIGDKKVIAEDYLGLDGCTYRISFISVMKEKDNKVVLFGIQKLKENI